MPWLESLFERYLQDEDEHYLLAVNEAVCNAARYAKVGYECVRIYIDVEVAPDSLRTTVTADTLPFDVRGFYKKMVELGKDEDIASEEWGDYTGDSDKSRGFWMMLMSCRTVDLDVNGKSVTLVAERPFLAEHVCKTVSTLVGRLRLVDGKRILTEDGKEVRKKHFLEDEP